MKQPRNEGRKGWRNRQIEHCVLNIFSALCIGGVEWLILSGESKRAGDVSCESESFRIFTQSQYLEQKLMASAYNNGQNLH